MTDGGARGRAVHLAAIAGLSLVAALVLQAAGTVPVAAAEGPPSSHHSHPLISPPAPSGGAESTIRELGWTSTNWSGYDINGAEFGYSAVTGCWTVPAVSGAAGDPTYSSAWIGIDGGVTGDLYLIQTGTEQDWSGGSAHYSAWWEILTPAAQPPATLIDSMAIHAGDAMCARIALTTPTTTTLNPWTIAIQDVSTGAQFSTSQEFGGPGESAEWILEQPIVCNPYPTNCVLSTLADYGQTTFDPVSVNGSNPELAANEGGDMTNSGGTAAISTPSNPDSDSDGFTVAYGPTQPAPPTTEYTPTMSSVSPASGPVPGGTSVTIGGAGFVPGATVDFGTTPATGVYFSSPYQISAIAPPGSVGTVSVTVTDPSDTSGSEESAFTYVPGAAYTALSPYRVCDTRPTSVTGYGTECSGHAIGQGATLDVQITGVPGGAGQSVPPDAESVVLNVTAVDGSATTYLTVFPAGTTPPNASNLNPTAGLNQANLVVVALGAGGQVGIYNSAGTINVAVDVEGYFAVPTATSNVPGLFHPIPPLRICDTRLGSGTACSGDSLGQGQWEKVVVSGCPTGDPSCAESLPTSDAATVALNLTGVNGSATTFLSVVPPDGSDQCPSAAPGFSNLNVDSATDLPNRVIVPLGPDQDVCVYNSAGAIDFILDLNGWFGNGSDTDGASFYATSPLRICDTRSSVFTGYSTECSGNYVDGGSAMTMAVAGVDGLPTCAVSEPPVAVIANVTAIAENFWPPTSTYWTLYPANVSQPNASDLNLDNGQTIPNLVIVQIAPYDASPIVYGSRSGSVDVFNDKGVGAVIVDVAGWFQ
jgi:hypothetical protein